MTRVLVTRPEPAASTTAAKLAGKGYSVTVLPLTRIVPLPLSSELPDGRFNAVVATSANAIRHAPAALLAALRDLPAFAVGESTAETFRRHDFTDVQSAGEDAEALAALVGGQGHGLQRLAYLCGRARMPNFEAEIEKNGMEIAAFETYDAEIVPYEADFLRNSLAGEPFDAVLLYSARAADACGYLLDNDVAQPALFQEARFVCLSARIAGALPGRWRERAVHCALPEESALFRLLANP
ncbi:MAG: uroporphyrinogen-III synthase [Rhizobiaceae bacterium]